MATPLASIKVLGNDTDPANYSVVVSIAIATAGVVAVMLDGTTLYYDPCGQLAALGVNGIVHETAKTTVSYFIADGNGGADTGRYMATTRPPITVPRNTIINGSIMDVRFSTA